MTSFDSFVLRSLLTPPPTQPPARSTPPCDDECASQDLDLLKANIVESGPASVCVNAATWNDYVGVRCY